MPSPTKSASPPTPAATAGRPSPPASTVDPVHQRKVPIVLVDDHPILRRGIAELINSESDMYVIGQAGNMQDAMTEVARLHPRLVIVDVSLDGNNGIELMKTLAARWVTIPLLAYSMHDEGIYAERALRAGAKGYVMKSAEPELLLRAIRDVIRGKIHLSPAMSDRLLGKLVGASGQQVLNASAIDNLSDRELEVLQMLGKGLTTAAIADKLSLSIKTIETYREHLKTKLNLENGQQLLRFAIEWSLSQSS